MWNLKTSALLSLVGVTLIWPNVLTKNVSPRLQMAGSSSLSAGIHDDGGNILTQGEERPHVVKRSITKCDGKFDNYCFNNGECMLLVDLKEHHCRCEKGFYGPRCNIPEFVFQPLGEEQIMIIIFCVILLMIGLAGALYFFCKWYKKNRFSRQQKRLGYKGVQAV